MTTTLALPDMVQLLEGSGDYRVLRRFQRVSQYAQRTLAADAPPLSLGLIVDAETTGLEADCKPIEVSAVQFEFDATGTIYSVRTLWSMLEDPGFPLSPEIVELTGITDEMLKGQRFNDGAVKAAVQESHLVLAWLAEFDRPILERRFPVFVDKHWACAMEEVPWDKFGARGKKQLDYMIEVVCGEFCEGHRAAEDCEVALHLLARPRATQYYAPAIDDHVLPPDWAPHREVTPFQILLEGMRVPRARVWAIDSPYEKKEVLKRRGYEWSRGDMGRRKGWWIDCPRDQVEVERAFLANEIYQSPHPKVFVSKITAKDRYSNRA